MKYLATLIFLVISSFSYSNQNMSLEERKLAVGSLYLSKCILGNLSNDFREASARFDKDQYLRKIETKDDTYKIYVDDWAATRVSVEKNSCMIEIANNNLQALVSSLPSVLEVGGGKLKLTKGKSGYEGNLIGGIQNFVIEADFHPDFPDRIAVIVAAE